MKVSLEESLGLKIGDVVQLKSGGPNMTIDSMYKYEEDSTVEIHCRWFFL